MNLYSLKLRGMHQGVVFLDNVQILGSYDASELIHDEMYGNVGIYFMRYHDYAYDSEFSDIEPSFASIHNAKDGTLIINNLYFGIGAHFSALYNQGTASIQGLQTAFSRQGSAYYDRWNLKMYTAIINYFGTLWITDSDVVGADTSLIDIYGGTVELNNVTLAQSMMGITTYYSAESISMNEVSLHELGTFYASLGAATYHNAKFSYRPIARRTPCHLAARSVSILNSSFSYVDPLGVIYIDEGILVGYESIPIDYGITIDPVGFNSLKMIDNEFILTLSADAEYNGYLYRSDFNHLQLLLNESFTHIASASILMYLNFFTGKWGDQRQLAKFYHSKATTGLIAVGDGYEFVIGNNNIFVDAAFRGNSTEIPFSPQLYIDIGSADGCIAGNVFENIDLVLKSGNIKSCKHPLFNFNQSQQFDEKCRFDLGTVDDTYEASEMINGSVIVCNAVDVILEDMLITSTATGSPLRFIGNSSKIALFDVVMGSETDIRFPSICSFDCHQISNDNQSLIRRLIVDCDSYDTNSSGDSTFSVRNSTGFVSLNADRVILNNNSEVEVYPGGYIPFSFSIVDRHGQIVDDYASNISMSLINEEINVNSRALITSGGVCSLSETGIYVQGINIDDVDKTYNITVQMIDNLDGLLTNNLTIRVIPCPSGYGVLGAAKQCVECSKGLYCITPTIDECFVCTEDMRGVECLGSDAISVSYNHWMDIKLDGRIVSSDCPNQHCCQKADGCDYVLDGADLCALHRDPMTPLCGKCEEGYSEKLGTVNCGICTRNRYEFFLIPLTLCAAFSCYLLCFDKRSPTRASTPELTSSGDNVLVAGSEVVWDDFKGLKTMILNVLLYYGQGLVTIMGQSTIQNGIFYFILPILQIFNLSFDFGVNSNAENAGWCIIEGLTAAQEISLYLFIPALLLFITGFMAGTYLCGVDWLNVKWCFCRYLKSYCSEIAYYSAFLRSLIISIGSIIAVIFKILSCRDIAGSDFAVHYYYGDTECFNWHWFVALSALFVLLGIWIILDVVSWRQSPEVRQNPDENHLFAFVNSYQPRYVAMFPNATRHVLN